MPSMFRIMQMVSCQLDTSSGTGTPSYEDLTTFTLVDPGGNAVVDTTSITITDLDTDWTDFYMYKDYGDRYFNPNYTIEYELTVTSVPSKDGRSFGIVKTAQNYGNNLDSLSGPVTDCCWYSLDPGKFELHTGHQGWSYTHDDLPIGVKYYCRNIRTFGGTVGSYITYVYSDPERSIPVGVPIGEDDIPIGYIEYGRYFMVGFSNRKDHESGNLATYKIENVEITDTGTAGTVIYTSDFSSGEDGWTAVMASVAGNIDGIDGEDNNLRFTANTENNNRWLEKTTTMDSAHDYLISFQYYIPAGQSNIDGIVIHVDQGGSNEDSPRFRSTGEWATAYFGTSAPQDTYIRIMAMDGSSSVFTDAGGDDVFYIRNLIIDEF